MDNNNQFDDLWQLLLANNGDKTLQIFDEILATNPHDVDALLGRGVLLSKRGIYSEAIESFTGAIRLASSNKLAMAFLGRALVYYEMNNFQKALDDCERSLEINPNESVVWKTKGAFLSALERYTEALNSFDEGLKLNPKDTKMIEFKKFLVDTFQKNFLKNLKKYENTAQETLNMLCDELRDRQKYDSYDFNALETSDEIIQKCMDILTSVIHKTEKELKEASQISQVNNQFLSAYYHIKAIESGCKAIYPHYNQEKLQESQKFLDKAQEFATADQDNNQVDNIISTEDALEARVPSELNQETKSSSKSSKNSLSNWNNNKFWALGISVFGVILLLSGQWVIALTCLGIAWYFWQA